jgi:hypothetical protein
MGAPALIPVMIKGIAPANELKITTPATAVLLVMRGPPVRRNPEARVRWFVCCQVSLAATESDLAKNPPMVSIPAYPPRRFPVEPHLAADELPLAPLPTNLCAVAIACYPLDSILWRFEFFTEQRQDPDASAEVLGFPIRTPHLECGLFRTPHHANYR